jgi:lipid-A-disaccharide synthase
VNLILNKLVVREFIQDDMNEENLKKELQELLTDADRRSQMQDAFQQLRTLLEAGGSASENAARIIVRELAK